MNDHTMIAIFISSLIVFALFLTLMKKNKKRLSNLENMLNEQINSCEEYIKNGDTVIERLSEDKSEINEQIEEIKEAVENKKTELNDLREKFTNLKKKNKKEESQ